MGTFFAKARHGKIHWQVIDAEGWALGRLAARATRLLMGKDTPQWTPHADSRRGLIVINASKVRLTGRKLDDKVYRHYTGYPGGLREITARQYQTAYPERMVRDAIVGMLPKTRLGDRFARRLKIYAGPTHPHQGQTPETASLAR